MSRLLSIMNGTAALLGMTFAVSIPIATVDWAARFAFHDHSKPEIAVERCIQELLDLNIVLVIEQLVNPAPQVSSPLLEWCVGASKKLEDTEKIAYKLRARRKPELVRTKLITPTPKGITYFTGLRGSVPVRHSDVTHQLILNEGFLLSSEEEQENWESEILFKRELDRGHKVPDSVTKKNGLPHVHESLGQYGSSRIKAFVNYWQAYRADGTEGRGFTAW